MADHTKKVNDELEKDNDLSIVDIVDGIIDHAYAVEASDIHIDPQEHSTRIGYFPACLRLSNLGLDRDWERGHIPEYI